MRQWEEHITNAAVHQYTIDEEGTIADTGIFEFEHAWVPIAYSSSLDGTWIKYEWREWPPMVFTTLDDSDRAALAEFGVEPDTVALVLELCSEDAVIGVQLCQEDLDNMMSRIEADTAQKEPSA